MDYEKKRDGHSAPLCIFVSPYWCVSVVAAIDSVSSRSLVFAAAASGVHTFPVIHFGTRLAVERRSLYGAVVTFAIRLDALYVRYMYIFVYVWHCARVFFFSLDYTYIHKVFVIVHRDHRCVSVIFFRIVPRWIKDVSPEKTKRKKQERSHE